MKKAFGFSLLFLLFFISVAFIGEGTASLSSGGKRQQNLFTRISGLAPEQHRRSGTKITLKNRNLKSSGFTASNEKNKPGTIDLEDYRPIDPVPSSKASIRPGPIQHGTPLMPYIPEPSPPPSRSKQGESP